MVLGLTGRVSLVARGLVDLEHSLLQVCQWTSAPIPERLSSSAGQKRRRIVLMIDVWSYSVVETVRAATHGETTMAGTRIP